MQCNDEHKQEQEQSADHHAKITPLLDNSTPPEMTNDDSSGPAAAAAMRDKVSSIATIPIESRFIPTEILHIALKAIPLHLYCGGRTERTVIQMC